MIGYYTPKSSFSVEHYKGQWIARARLNSDKPAQTPEQLAAISLWLESGRHKFSGTS